MEALNRKSVQRKKMSRETERTKPTVSRKKKGNLMTKMMVMNAERRFMS